MSDDTADLLRLAGEYADKDVDLYDLLGVDALTPKEEIRRAWRKRSLKYHPDKAGSSFDAAKWELFERARDILSEPNARSAYDNAMKAKILRKQERDAMDRERKKFADDLEQREDAARRVKQEKSQRDREAMQKERERLAETQRLREQEIRRQNEAAQEMEDLSEARRRLKEKKDEKMRRKQAKQSMKASGMPKPSGPANGLISVPGNYVVNVDGQGWKYWELVCDKLKAVQMVRNLQAQQGQVNSIGDESKSAEKAVQEARRRIQEAEVRYQKETAATF